MNKINLNNLYETIIKEFKEMGCTLVYEDERFSYKGQPSVDHIIATKEQALKVKDYIINNCVKSIKEQLQWRCVQERDFEEPLKDGYYHTYIGTYRCHISIRVLAK